MFFKKQKSNNSIILNPNQLFPPGHFYSPIANIDYLKTRENEIWPIDSLDKIPAIDLNTSAQLQLLEKFKNYYKELPFKEQKQPGLRYFFENDAYSYSDAIMLYCFIRHLDPKKIIEVGSGYSSSLMLDTNEKFKKNIDFTFIEPNSQLLKSLISEKDKQNVKIIEQNLQEIDKQIFKELDENDILFIDSTHVSKTDSDVNHIIFNILPLLKKGVYIHFHDVFYPFEYPKNWVYEGRNWNEDYILRAFLEYNEVFKIQYFAHYIGKKYFKQLKDTMPLCTKNIGGNLWLKKIK